MNRNTRKLGNIELLAFLIAFSTFGMHPNAAYSKNANFAASMSDDPSERIVGMNEKQAYEYGKSLVEAMLVDVRRKTGMNDDVIRRAFPAELAAESIREITEEAHQNRVPPKVVEAFFDGFRAASAAFRTQGPANSESATGVEDQDGSLTPTKRTPTEAPDSATSPSANGSKEQPNLALSQHAEEGSWVESAKTQADMNEGAYLDFKHVEDEMTILYRNIIKRYSAGPDANPAFVDKLRKAQRAWIAFRDAHIESVYPSEGTHFSAEGMCVVMLRTELTKARIAQLREWWDGIEDGDICAGTRPSKK